MWFSLRKTILVVLFLTYTKADSHGLCFSNDLDKTVCSALKHITGSQILDSLVNDILGIVNRLTNGNLQTPLNYFGKLFQSNPTNEKSFNSFARSFHLIVVNPGGSKSRNISLTDVLNGCDALKLSGTSTKLFWSGYNTNCYGTAPTETSLGFTDSELQQYADETDSTIISVDWNSSGLSCYGYFQIQLCMIDEIVELFTKWLSKCVNIETLDIVGHSLGSQITGYLAQRLKSHGFLVRSLFALDPAGPGFGEPLRCEGVQTGVAKYVAAFHCNPGLLATSNFHIGNASILMNPQCNFCQVGCNCNPGCAHTFCRDLFLKLTQNHTITATRTDSPLKCPGDETTQLKIFDQMPDGYYCVDTYDNEECSS